MLDAAFGNAAYRAILVVHSETNATALGVAEITVPDQWVAYQGLLARMDRIYYFDMPVRYVSLAQSFPDLGLRPFAEFFTERAAVLSSQPV